MEIRFLRTADLFILGREFECSETQPRNLHRVRNYRSVRLPSLKVLHLRSVTYANNKSVSKLLQRTFKDNARNFIVHLPTLKTLNIKVQFDKMSKLRSKYDLTINAPNLGYLEIIDWESVIHFERVFISLVEANVCYYGTALFRMVEALCNAKFLHLKWTHYCDFRALRKDEAFPLFPNLTQLELNFGTKKDETF
ncbi:hypothetical protein Godav_018980, partial [Gossypium davidsonii]|nr:hypothetical protein [Gossypium davidsonii]